ncbi:hypothetical protein PM082_009545 [Marasmius tenuissimus]|nr:hypothetical protein PM082_009545 [Marasmius tenuissimus]
MSSPSPSTTSAADASGSDSLSSTPTTSNTFSVSQTFSQPFPSSTSTPTSTDRPGRGGERGGDSTFGNTSASLYSGCAYSFCCLPDAAPSHMYTTYNGIQTGCLDPY